MSTVIIVLILIMIAVFAIRSSIKHVKGGCCGGGCGSIREESVTLKDPVIDKKEIRIEGMHCENCVNSVMRQLQKIDGVSSTVNLKKKTAYVQMSREVPEDDLRLAVERVGYQVVSIQ